MHSSCSTARPKAKRCYRAASAGHRDQPGREAYRLLFPAPDGAPPPWRSSGQKRNAKCERWGYTPTVWKLLRLCAGAGPNPEQHLPRLPAPARRPPRSSQYVCCPALMGNSTIAGGLQFKHFGVTSAHTNKMLVGPFFSNVPGFEDDNPVGHAYGRKTMRDE